MHDNLKDTIVAISTPIGEGGIGIVRLSGTRALTIADKIFLSKDSKKPSTFDTYTMRYGHVARSKKVSGNSKDKKREIIDEVVLTVMRAPKTYTKEDIVEINCHGGIVPLKKVMEETVFLGARPAGPGEFTKRAFLNGRIDLAQAEAVQDLIKAKTDMSLKVALSHLEGDFSGEVIRKRETLLDILKDIEKEIDFSGEDIDTLSKKDLIRRLEKSSLGVKKILDTHDSGMLLKEGVTCVICGKPNVGKSSLLNTLLKRNRAIVTHIPGTTRDVIEEVITIKGAALKLVDTAGIVKSRNIVEKKGVERTRAYLKKADFIIFMLDLSQPLDKKDREIMKLLPIEKIMVVANKSDLKKRLDLDEVNSSLDKEVLKISVLKRKNVDLIEKNIGGMIWSGKLTHPEPAFLTNIRHKKALEEALKSLRLAISALKKDLPFELAAVDMREAIFRLGLITGESVDVNILDRIFEKFCIGK